MRKYTITDDLISGLLGVAIAIPIVFTAWDSWDKDPEPETIETNSEAFPIGGVEEAFQIDDNQVEEIIAKDHDEKVLLGDFTVTAYCPCAKCCPGTSDGITYTETIATEGRTLAVDPEVIPLGSIVEVNGENYVAEDIGGAIKRKHIELYFDNHDDALQWGKQLVPVYMVEECLGEF